MDFWATVLWTFLALYGAAVLVAELLGQWRGRWWWSGGRPLISLLILVRNQEQVIQAFLEELLGLGFWGGRQHQDYELLVVDQGSTDDTARIVERLACRHQGLQLVRDTAGDSGWRTPLGAGRGRLVLLIDLEQAADPLSLLPAIRRLLARDDPAAQQVTTAT